MSTRPAATELSDKEKALIAAARAEAARRSAQATPPASVKPTAAAATAPVASAPAAAPATAKPAPASPSLQERLAVLMEEERLEKVRRNRAYMRWKIGAGVFATVLVLWFVIAVLGQIKH